MNGLMMKDFLTIKKKYGLLRLIIDSAIIAALLILAENTGVIIVSLLLIPLEVMSILTTLADCDEKWKWEKYAISLPVSTKQIIGSRYNTALALSLVGFVVSIVINIVGYFLFAAYPLNLYLCTAVFSLATTILFSALILPLNVSLGANGGFVVLLVFLMLALIGGFTVRVSGIDITALIVDNFYFSIAVVAIGIVATCILSYVLSVHLFGKKHS
jgi:hypothetical protein